MSVDLLAFILRRIVTATLTIIGVSFLLFLLLQLAPGDPVSLMVAGHNVPQETIDKIRKSLNLDKPLYMQYWLWLKGFLHGDLGTSFLKDAKVSKLILERLPVSLQLVLGSGLLTLLLSIPTGVWAALKRGRLIDNFLTVLAIITACMPVFWVAMIFIIIFSVWLHWFPSMGLEKPFDIKHLVLPCTALSFSYVGLLYRMVRASMGNELLKNYVTNARTMGLPNAKITLRVFKNSLGPVLTVSGFMIGAYIVFAVMVEYVFGLAGVGSLLINSTLTQDFPTVMGITLFISATFVISNFIVDILYAVLDPRIRFTKKK
ncbi:ABC transporter permease [candidate division WOR-3 bacterium]|nr:ABC transporter permease [candidate division WOR-3 bacterium]